jgi:diguanylate cyclase (GGDEF)-like protein
MKSARNLTFTSTGMFLAAAPAMSNTALVTALSAVVFGVIVLAAFAVWRSLKRSSVFSTTLVDPVTGVFNQLHFRKQLEAELDRAKRSSETLCLAVIDIDDFRTFNNTYGHQAGDAVLVAAARAMRQSTRKSDVICRTGGDEFAIIMPNTRLLDGQHICDRINGSIVQSINGVSVRARLSIGIASYPYHAREADMLYKLADDAMYWAKYHGKNQVTVFDYETMESFNSEERMRKAEEMAHQNTVQTLAMAMDARNDTTRGHAKNVATLAEIFASRLNLSKHKIDMIRVAALVHDIGKIGMSGVARKDPAELTDEERIKLQQHPRECQDILIATDLGAVVPWVAAHHERWDGGGYPAGLEGSNIPYEARVIALCDEYENLTRPSQGKAGLSHSDAVAEIISERGRKFDPVLTDAFIHLVDLLNSMLLSSNARKPAAAAAGTPALDDEIGFPEREPADLYALVRAKLRS